MKIMTASVVGLANPIVWQSNARGRKEVFGELQNNRWIEIYGAAYLKMDHIALKDHEGYYTDAAGNRIVDPNGKVLPGMDPNTVAMMPNPEFQLLPLAMLNKSDSVLLNTEHLITVDELDPELAQMYLQKVPSRYKQHIAQTSEIEVATEEEAKSEGIIVSGE